MKFDPLIEYKLRNIFHEKSCAKYGGETILGPFFKKLNLSISLDQCCKVSDILFLLFAKLRIIKTD